MTIQLKVLGGLALTRGGCPVVGGASQRRSLALLAVLAAHGKRGVSREKLAALLWPESDQDDARNSLKQTVYILRRELGAEGILGATELRLDLDVVSCDRVVFEQLLAREELEPAIEAYTGHFLDGFHLAGDSEEFERWADAERARLARCYHDGLETLAAAATARGDHAGSLRWWRRLAAIDPLDGRRARGIVASLLALGDRPSALRHAETYRALLAAELGLSPDAELEQLIAVIRASPRVATAGDAAVLTKQPAPAPILPTIPSPRARHRGWIGLAAASAIAAVGAAIWWAVPRRTLPLVDPRRVALVAAALAQGDTTTSTSQSLIQSIARRLTAASVATPVVLSVRNGANAREAAVRAGAGVLVTVARVGSQADDLEAALTVATTGEQLWGLRSPPRVPSSASATDALAERIATAVATRLDPKLSRWIGRASEPSSLESYREFRRGLDLYADHQPGAATPHFLAAGMGDSSFTMTLVFAAWAFYYSGQPGSADSLARLLDARRLAPLDQALVVHQLMVFAGDLNGEYRAAGVLAALAPRSEWGYLLAESAVRVGRAGEAIRVLEGIGPDLGWLENSPGYRMLLGRALHFAGEHERELVAMEEARRRFPTNRIIAQMVLKALAALGRVAEVDAEIDRAFALKQMNGWSDNQPMDQTIAELDAHGYPDAARRLAERTAAWIRRQPAKDQLALAPALLEFLVDAGRLREARRLALQLIAEGPEDLDVDAILARISVEQGESAPSRRLDARLARMSDPRLQTDVLLYRAGIATNLGDREAAVGLIQDACRAGFAWRSVLHQLREFAPLRGYPPFDRLARPVD